MLLDQGADPDTTKKSQTLLFQATQLRNKNIIQILINAGADVNKKSLLNTVTPFGIATFHASLDIMHMLEHNGAHMHKGGMPSMSETIYFGKQYIPMHEAANQGKTAAIKILLQLGVNPNLPDNAGRTPLHRAASKNQTQFQFIGKPMSNTPVIYVLGAYKANPDITDHITARTALHVALLMKQKTDIIKALAEIGADPNQLYVSPSDHKAITPLEITIESMNPQAAEMLLEYGAKVTQKDLKKATQRCCDSWHENQQDAEKMIITITNALQRRELTKARRQYERTGSPHIGKLPPEMIEKIIAYNR
jgi:ankyrin repeat protein